MDYHYCFHPGIDFYMKKVIAYTHLSVDVSCPYCGCYQDKHHDLAESMGFDLEAKDVNIQVECEDCTELFEVEHIEY